MSESKVFVQPIARKYGASAVVPQEDLKRLADLLRGEALDAQYGEHPEHWDSWSRVGEDFYPRYQEELRPPKGIGVGPWIDLFGVTYQTVCIWFAQGAVLGLGGRAALAIVKWMKEWARRKVEEGKGVYYQEDAYLLVLLIEDKGEEGEIRLTMELESRDSKPVVREIRAGVRVEKHVDAQKALSMEEDQKT